MALTLVSSNRSFGGEQKIFSHESKELKCSMRFAIYLPAECTGDAAAKVPVIYWLSGLTCNETNFVQKAGAQRYAAQYGFIVVCPDTSPRGCGVPGEDDSWDFGTGAGFYVDATVAPWRTNYRMYSYVTEELPQLVEANFPASLDERSIMGHSMGGHGALICFLRNPGRYRSVSAFAPICHPMQCPWGRKALAGYLGADSGDGGEGWDEWDATKLVAKYDGLPVDILIDQGKADEFLSTGQLQPEAFVAACKEAQVSCVLNMHEGYDHSYYYIATFIGEHFRHHARFLSASPT